MADTLDSANQTPGLPDIASLFGQTQQDRPMAVGATSFGTAPEAIAAEPAAPGYKPLFRYASRDQLDADPDGTITQLIGNSRGEAYGPDKILELNLYGEALPAESILKMEGGEALLTLAARARSGRRGFAEALATGAPTDFVPFAADIASAGIAIKNMAKVRDSFKKLQEQGPDALSLQEKVFTKLYMEDSIRQSQQTWGGLVGSIVRQAPAFAFEFALTGGLLRAGTSAAKLAVKEGAEEMGSRLIRKAVKDKMIDQTSKVAGAAVSEIDDKLLQTMARETSVRLAKGAEALELEGKLLAVAKLQKEAVLNPKRFQGTVDFFSDYLKRGLLDHADDALANAPAGWKGKLREAAGNLLVEVPIKGTLYSAFDFTVANPMIARAFGGTEAVTRSELMFSTSDDPAIAANAKWMAFGSAWTEYASEFSGRAFNMVGGIAADAIRAPAAKLAAGAMAALPDSVQSAVKQGGYVRRLLAADAGVYGATAAEAKAGVKAEIAAQRLAAAKNFAGTEGFENMTAEMIVADKKLSDAVTKRTMAQNTDKSFFGFWLADKMVNLGWGPEHASKWLKNMAYDELLGEFMEERYNGFMQGLMGLDGQSDPEGKSVIADRLARAAKGFFPAGGGEGAWSQGTAEIVAFALPMVSRATVNRAFAAVGGGAINKTAALTSQLAGLLAAPKGVLIDDETGAPGAREFLPVAEAGTPEEKAVRENLGQIVGDLRATPVLDSMADNGVEAAMAAGKMFTDQPGIGQRVARAALGMVNFAITGNPMMMFNNPMDAIVKERLGNGGGQLLADLSNLYQDAFERERSLRASGEAGAAFDIAKEAERMAKESGGALTEAAASVIAEQRASAMTSTDIKAIDDAIRPQLAKDVRQLIKSHLHARGMMLVEKSDISDLIADIKKENGGVLPTAVRDGEAVEFATDAEFAKAFRGELSKTAAERMSVKVVNGQAVFSVEKPVSGDGSDMFGYVDRMFAKRAVNSIFNLSKAAELHGMVAATSAAPVPMSVFVVAAGVKDLTRASPAQYAALRAVREAVLVNPGYERQNGSLRADALARDRARQIVAVHRNLMLPAFSKDGKRVQTVFDSKAQTFSLRGSSSSFSDMASLTEAAVGAGYTQAEEPKIFFTPYNQYFSETAAEAMALFGEYFEGREHDNNPFRKVGAAEGKLTLAEARAKDADNRKRAAAGDTAMAQLVADYDDAAKKALADLNIRQAPLLSDATKQGYILAAGALSDDLGNVYIPMKSIASSVSLVEDAIESAYKRDRAVFTVAKIGGAVEYRPAARAFIKDVQGLVEKKLDQMRGMDAKTRTSTDEEIMGQLESLSRILNADKVNTEAVSKTIAGIALYYGDAAVSGIGSRRSEGALYTALGLVAKDARSQQSYKPFLSLVSRMAGFGELSVNPEGLAGFVRELAPAEFIDGNDKALPSSLPGVNAIQHILTSAAELKVEIGAARTFMASNELAKPVFAILDQGAFLPEDLPSEMLRFIRETNLDGAYRHAAGANPAPASAKEEPAAVEPVKPLGESPTSVAESREAEAEDLNQAEKPKTASLLESLRDPAQATFLALAAAQLRNNAEIMKALGLTPDTKLVLPGDKDFIKKAWDFWKAADDSLTDADEPGFITAYASATGKFNSSMDIVNEAGEAVGAADIEITPDNGLSGLKADDTTRFDDDGIRKAFDRYPLKEAVGTFMSLHLFNPAKADLEGHVQDLFEGALSADGSYAWDGLAGLLSGIDGKEMHPALVRETFEPWINARLKGASRVELGFLIALKSMKFDDAAVFLKNVRGCAVAGAVRFENGLSEEGGLAKVRVGFTIDTRTAPEGARRSLELAIRTADATGVAKAKAAMDAIVKRGPLQSLPGPENMPARVHEISVRFGELAGVIDSLFGSNSYLSTALRSEALAIGVARYSGVGGSRESVDAWLSSYSGGGKTYLGFMAQRLADAVTEFAASKNGRLAVDKLFQDNVATFDASNRGSFNTLINLYARVATPLGKARNTTRSASVALSMPARSSTMLRTLRSKEFKALALSFYGYDEASLAAAGKEAQDTVAKSLVMMERFARWPDGTPVFANVLGARFGYDDSGERLSEPNAVGEVSSEFVAEAFRRAYDNPGLRFAGYQLASGDKTKPLTILVPKFGRNGVSTHTLLTGASDYASVYRAVAKVAGIKSFDLKRVGAVTLNYGPVIPMVEGTVLATVVPQEDLSQEAAEAMFGGLRLFSKTPGVLQSLMKRVLKAHGTAPEAKDGSSVMIKGLMMALVKEDLKNPYMSDSEAALTKLFLEESEGLGENVIWGDQDGMKVTFQNSKVSGIAGAKLTPAYQWLLAHPEANEDTEVMWQGPSWAEPRKIKLSEVAPGLKIKRDVKLATGKLVTIISYAPPGLRLQEVANLSKDAKPKAADIARNATRDTSKISSIAEHRLTAAAVDLLLAAKAAHPPAEPPKYRDEAIAIAVARGTLSPLAEIAARDVASGLARRAVPETGLALATIKAANVDDAAKARAGATGPAFTADGATIDVASPYGAGHALSHGEMLIPESEAEAYNGIRIRPASIQANVDDPLFRYALKPNLGHPGFSGMKKAAPAFDLDAKAYVAQIIESKLLALDTFRGRNDRSGYLRYLATEIMPMFTDLEGNGFRPGQIFSFDDLFINTPGGERVFDRTAFENDAKGNTVLNGGRMVMLRVPSGGPDAWVEARVFAPVTEGVRTRRAMASEKPWGADSKLRPDGQLSWTSKTEAEEGMPGGEALVRDNADITARTGNDHDGDTAFLWMFKSESTGYSKMITDPSAFFSDRPEAVIWREELMAMVSDPDPKASKQALQTINRWIWNSWLNSKMNWLRFADTSKGRREGDAAPADVEVSTLGITAFATSADPLTPEFKAELDRMYPGQKLDRGDYKGAAVESDTARHMSSARGNAVHAWALLHHLFLTFDATVAPLNNGNPVLLDADGTAIEGMTVDLSRPYSEDDWTMSSRFMSKWANAFFDSLKGDASSERYGMDSTLVPLHFLMLASARPKTQDEYQAFFRKWAAWANGPQAKAIVANSRAQENPFYDGSGRFGADQIAKLGGQFSAPVKALDAALMDSVSAYNGLDYGSRRAVLAAAAAYVNSGKSVAVAADAVIGIAEALGVLENTRALLRTLEVENINLSSMKELVTAARHTDNAKAVLGGDTAIELHQNLDVLGARIRQTEAVRALARDAYKNTYEGSGLCVYIAAMNGRAENNGTPRVTRQGFRKAMSAKEPVMRAVYARASMLMLPPAIGNKIVRASGGTVEGFLAATEDMYRQTFRAYAGGVKRLGWSNAFLNQVLAPPAGAKSDFQAVSLMSRDVADSMTPDLEAGLKALRDWDARDTRLDSKIGDTVMTPKDLYWALWLYTNLIGTPGVKLSRGSANFAAAYGAEMVGELAQRQVDIFGDSDWHRRIFNLAIAKYPSTPNTVSYRGMTGIPNVFGIKDTGPAPKPPAPYRPRVSDTDVVKNADTSAPAPAKAVAPVTSMKSETAVPRVAFVQAPSNISGMVGDSGPGTKAGTGADKAMRDVVVKAKAPAMIAILKPGQLSRSSTGTSLLTIAAYTGNPKDLGGGTFFTAPLGAMMASKERPYAPGEAICMVAGNSGTHLTPQAKAQLSKLVDAGFEFVTGSMPDHTDTEAAEFLAKAGAKVTIYSWRSLNDPDRMSDWLRTAIAANISVRPMVNKAAAEALAALNAVVASRSEGSRLRELADRGARWQLTEAQKQASEAVASALAKVGGLPGIPGTKAEAVLAAAASAVRVAGGDRALIDGALLAAADAAALSATPESAEVLKAKAGVAGSDSERLDILRANAAVVFGDNVTPEFQVAMYAVAVSGFPRPSQGGAKTSAIATAVAGKIWPGKAMTASLLSTAQDRFMSTDNRVRDIENALANPLSEAYVGAPLHEQFKRDLSYWKGLRERAKADVEAYKRARRTASLVDGAVEAEAEDLDQGGDARVYGGAHNPEDEMSGKDLAEASSMAAKAVGVTPDRGNAEVNPDGTETKAGVIMRGIRELRAATDFSLPRGEMETEAAHLARIGALRRESLGAVAKLTRDFIVSDGAGAARAFDAELKGKLARLRELGGEAARTAEAVERFLYRDRDGNPGALQFFGGVQDFDRFKEMDKYLGNLQSGVNASYSREEAAAGTPAQAAAAAAARGLVNDALNLARTWTSATRMLKAEGALVQAQIAFEGHPAPETPPSQEKARNLWEGYAANVMQSYDPATSAPDPWNNFHVLFMDTDVFYNGAIMPFFRGQSLRDILLDKASIAAQVDMYRTGNLLTGLYAAGNSKGTILRMKKIEGAGFRPDGKGGYETTPEDMRGESRWFERGTAGRDLRRDSFTPEEFALSRFMLGAIGAALGDGGVNAKMPVSGKLVFRDLPHDQKLAIGIAEARRRVAGLRADENGNPVRPYAVDVMLLNAVNNLPRELYRGVEDAVKAAYDVYLAAEGNSSDRELKAVESMRAAGYANRRTGTGPRGETYLVSSTLTVPVADVEKVWLASSAYGKLLDNGREAKDLTLAAGMGLAEAALKKARASEVANLSWLLSDTVRPMHALGGHAPFYSGTGFHSFLAKKSTKAGVPEYGERMSARYKSLVELARSCFDKNGNALALRFAEERFPRLLKYYSDLFLKEGDPLKNDAVALLQAMLDRNSSRYLGRDATAWTLATKIYEETSRRIHETVMRDGTVGLLELGDVSLEEFNAAIDSVAQEKEIDSRRNGMTWTQIYESDGALPKNLGVDEMLTQFAQEIATATRFRLAMNQGLLSADENGRPLIYAEPGAEGDDTVPERMWKMTAMWWADVHGLVYDQSKSGRDNAKAMYPEIIKGKLTQGGVQEAEGSSLRYIFRNVTVPPGLTAFSRVVAASNPAGDDTKSAFSVFTGGEAAGMMTQIMSVPGYGHPGAALSKANHFLSWSKSGSVMWSWFFPIATAFESPVAAVGMGQTLAGLTQVTAEAARKTGYSSGSPYMADIMRLIGSDDPALAELKAHAMLCGLTFADRSRNMLDHDRVAIAKDIKNLSDLAAAHMGVKAGRFTKAMLEGALEQSSELAFEYVINATKLAVFAQMNNILRNKAEAAGKWWDPIRSMREWAPYINAEVGGIDPAMYAWSTPQAQRIMKCTMFSWEWTLGAWSAGGGDVLTAKLFGMSSSPALRQFMFGRWFRMFTGIMIGVPVAMQIFSTAMGRIASHMGGDDDYKSDKWFNWQNEMGRGVKDFDLTPLLRAIAKVPGVVDFKVNHPVLGSVIPALSGQEGEMTSTRRRRYYAHMGKQGWEVAGWFEDPVKSFLGKLSMPAQRGLEGVLGITPSMGWEKDWKDLGFWERWTTLDPDKSALLNMFGAVVPFSLAGVSRSPEAGIINAIMPVGKGMSKTRAEKEMARMFVEWGDSEAYAAKWKGRPGAWTDLTSMAGDWLEALRLNGYDPATSLKNALQAARKPLYERVHRALPSDPREKLSASDRTELEAAARGLYRLDFVAKSLMKSIKARDKNQNIKRVDDLAKTTDTALRDAFTHPFGHVRKLGQPEARVKGTVRDAALGGDVRGFLATDEVPATMLGYKVLKTEELSPEDLQYFKENPEAAGHFDMNQKGVK